jgi:DNA-binding response OmpR family regulator
VALLIESFLSRLGYRVVYASSFSEAIRTADAYGDALDLVISGVSLASPGGSLLKTLRQSRPDLPAVLVSGFSSGPQDLPLSNDRTAILTKPFSMSELAGAARSLLDRESASSGRARTQPG